MSGPGYPTSSAGEPPPGQGYYHNNAGRRDHDDDRYDDRYDRSPIRSQRDHPPSGPGYPPSERDYDPRDYAESRAAPPSDRYGPSYSQTTLDRGPRGGAPDDRSEYSRAPPSEYTEYSRGPRRSRSRSRRDSRSRSRSASSASSRSRSHSRPRSQRRRRRHRHHDDRSKTPPLERAMGYPSDPKKGGRDVFGGSEGEKGLGAALAGGAGGAWLGHEFGKGTLETLAGGIAGAIAARAIERRVEKKKEEKKAKKRYEEAGMVPAGAGYPPPGRGMGDVRESGRDGVYKDRERDGRSASGGRRSGSRRRRDRRGSSSSSEGYGRD